MSAVLLGALPIIDKVLDMIPNAEARARAKRELTLELVKIEAQERIAQVDLNKVEATHKSLFVAGWRPFIGWVGGFALAWTFLIHPMISWVAVVSGYIGELPLLETSDLMTLVMAMLGIGAMRSFDKFKGTETTSVSRVPGHKPTYNE